MTRTWCRRRWPPLTSTASTDGCSRNHKSARPKETKSADKGSCGERSGKRPPLSDAIIHRRPSVHDVAVRLAVPGLAERPQAALEVEFAALVLAQHAGEIPAGRAAEMCRRLGGDD